VELTAADVARLLSGIHADPDDLLNAVRPHITDSMLQEIAEADYGHNSDLHLAALRRIRDNGSVPSPLPWEPAEVCRLIRWSRPHDPNWQPGSTGRRGHVMRAFCCAVLLRDPDEDPNNVIAPVLESTLEVPEIPPGAALSTFAALAIECDLYNEDGPLLALGVLLAALAAHPGQLEPAESVIQLCHRWEFTIRNGHRTMPARSTDWIFGLNSSLSHDAWSRAAKIVLIDRVNTHHPSLQAELAEIAEHIRRAR